MVVFTISCESNFHIVDGKATSIDNYPWTGSINAAWGVKLLAQYQCTAAIIGEKWLITSAHCHMNLWWPFYQFVRVGSNSSTSWGDKFDIEKWIIHPDYSNDNAKNDLAIIKLKEELKFSENIKAIKMVNEYFTTPEGSTVKVAAFGTICDDCQASDELIEAVLSTCTPLKYTTIFLEEEVV